MKLTKVVLRNFRSFGPEDTTIQFDRFSTLLGANGAGKTTVLEALAKLFGSGEQRRTIVRGDFHVPEGSTLENVADASLRIEAWFELSDDEDYLGQCERATGLDQLTIEHEAGPLLLRAVLEASWSPGPDPEGVIDPSIYWATVADHPVPENKRSRMKATDRARIQVQYVPAVREPGRQLRNVAGTLLNRVFRSIVWTVSLEVELEEASKTFNTLLFGELGLQLLRDEIREEWSAFHPSKPFGKPQLTFGSNRLGDVLSNAELVFETSGAGTPATLAALSDGQRSLFYLSLMGAVFQLERAVLVSTPFDGSEPMAGSPGAAISSDRMATPLLTVFAIEEPESHLSPHYLGRITARLRKLTETSLSQVILTTHSPSIMRRIQPEEVRHLRLDDMRRSIVSTIQLPTDDAEAARFINAAVRSHPELYFASLVVLGEGDSEEVALPRILDSQGLEPDPLRISVVPLGGRFVNHLWRLLDALHIPYVTLLDLDWGRFGGGWGRIKYACEMLVQHGAVWGELCKGLPDAQGDVVENHQLTSLHQRTDTGGRARWLLRLEEYGVFFSAPLDLDFDLLRSFETEYKAVSTGITLPEDAAARQTELDDATRAVLKKRGNARDYNSESIELFPWYEHLFLRSSKPATHLQVLSNMSDDTLRLGVPSRLLRMCRKINAMLSND